MASEFNALVNPKAATKLFKLYADISESGAVSPRWELQGRGIESWTVEENEDITKTPDVLGYIDMERGVAQQTQTGIRINIRKDSVFGGILFDAWYTRDKSKLNSMKFLQKFEFVDGTDETTCKARLEEDVMVAITSFEGEASGYLAFIVDFHYANKSTTGTMPKKDSETVTFNPDTTTVSE